MCGCPPIALLHFAVVLPPVVVPPIAVALPPLDLLPLAVIVRSTMRGQERGWCNKRTIRDDDATTSWRDETARGGTTRQQDNERTEHREATQQPAGTTRG
jgi:hypothetical protein